MRRRAILALALLAGCDRTPDAPAAPALTSTSVDLPAETETLPPGSDVGLVTANCTACHSASMITTQPRLSAEKWQEEVTKMRDVYKAPIAKTDDAAIVGYLAGMRVSAVE